MKRWVVIGIMALIFIMTGDCLAGSLKVRFSPANTLTNMFVTCFVVELLGKGKAIDEFVGNHVVGIYFGNRREKTTGQARSVIGIFIDNEVDTLEEPFIVISADELSGKRALFEKAQEAAQKVFEHLRVLEAKEEIFI